MVARKGLCRACEVRDQGRESFVRFIQPLRFDVHELFVEMHAACSAGLAQQPFGALVDLGGCAVPCPGDGQCVIRLEHFRDADHLARPNVEAAGNLRGGKLLQYRCRGDQDVGSGARDLLQPLRQGLEQIAELEADSRISHCGVEIAVRPQAQRDRQARCERIEQLPQGSSVKHAREDGSGPRGAFACAHQEDTAMAAGAAGQPDRDTAGQRRPEVPLRFRAQRQCRGCPE